MTDPTLIQGRDLDDPEQVKLVIVKMLEQIITLEADIHGEDGIDDQIEEINKINKPVRWLFSKVSGYTSLAISSLVTLYLTGFFD